MFSWLGAGCIRFLSADLCDRADGARFRHERRRSHFRNYHHAGDAASGCVHLRPAWRPLWAADSPDDQHHFLFADGIADSVFAELHRAAYFSGPVWDRNGRRVGVGSVTGNGNIAYSSTRIVLRNFAARICFRLPLGGGCLLDRVSTLRLARSLHCRRVSSGSGHLYSCACPRIACLVTTTAYDGRFLGGSPRCAQKPLGAFSLRGFADDGVQRDVARHAGHVSNIPWRTAPLRCYTKGDDRNYLCVRGNLRWDSGGPSLAEMGTSSVHCFMLRTWNRADSSVGVFAGIHASSDWGICDAIHGARRLGDCASASE